jgi:hypothetical protein
LTTDYQYYIGSKRNDRKSAKLLSRDPRDHKESKSNMKTQCDSKAPSLFSGPMTPISQRKSLTPCRAQKNIREQYHALLKSKK